MSTITKPNCEWDDRRGVGVFGGFIGDWAHVLHYPTTRGRKKSYYGWHVYINSFYVGWGHSETRDEAKAAAEQWERENGDEYRKRYPRERR